MAFTTLTCMFLFLPVMLAVYFLTPARFLKARTAVLLVGSLLFYAWGDMRYLPVLALSVGFHLAAGRELAYLRDPSHADDRLSRALILCAAGVDVGALAFFKYSGWTQPIGVSFYTFTALSYLFDIYRDKAEVGDLLTDACYLVFFPKLVSGPIVPYSQMRDQLMARKQSRGDLLSGAHLFVVGLFKKVLLADQLGVAFAQMYGQPQLAALSAWLGMIAYGLQLYFDFSGYSDMAIGLARMFGFRFDRNFNYPYLSDGVTDFWRRWHISLGAWFREYVYIPLGGNRCSAAQQVRNLAVVWLLTGIWHGSTLNFVFWGLYHGAFVLLEKFVLKERRKKWPLLARILLTDLVAFVGWIFFFNPTLGASFAYIGKLFGADGLGFANAATLYFLRNNALLLAAATIGCGRFADGLHRALVYRDGRGFWPAVVLHVVLFVFCVANMVGSTYQTFLYFRF